MVIEQAEKTMASDGYVLVTTVKESHLQHAKNMIYTSGHLPRARKIPNTNLYNVYKSIKKYS